MSSLELKAVTKRLGEAAAVSAVDLSIPAGSRAVIVGPSGSGKTTLLRLIAGFEFPDQGRVCLGGQVIAEGGGGVPAHGRGIGYVPQDGALFPHLDVASNIGFAMAERGEARMQRVQELAAMVQLQPTLLQRWPHELSGGQQQRVALARALAQRPRLMLLDEPFSALDTHLRASLRKMVREVLANANITSVLVTHDQEEALSFAQYLAVMRTGKVVQAGTPQALYQQPADELTAKFLGDAVVLLARLRCGWAECELGHIKVAATVREGVGNVMLRPEQLCLLGAEDLAGALATVVSQEYTGSGYRLVLLLPGSGTEFSLRVPADREWLSGQAVRVGVNGQAHVLRPSEV